MPHLVVRSVTQLLWRGVLAVKVSRRRGGGVDLLFGDGPIRGRLNAQNSLKKFGVSFTYGPSDFSSIGS